MPEQKRDRSPDSTSPIWMTVCLVIAAIYNLLWGAVVIAFPTALFELIDLAPPRYPQIWQCVGMIVGVYGVGYAIASANPARHWPIVLVGLLGKVLGPLGFLGAAIRGELPWSFGWTIITNDLIWWAPFSLILLHAVRTHRTEVSGDDPSVDLRTVLETATSTGATLKELSRERPLLLVLLRHTGCSFCREALSDLATRRSAIEASGTGLVLVHMGSDEQGRRTFARYGLDDLPRISDPHRRLYRGLDLHRGRFGQLFGPKVWWRGIQAVLAGHLVGKLVGAGTQMPGLFLLHDGRIVRSIRHRSAADRPDYQSFACPEPGHSLPRGVQ